MDGDSTYSLGRGACHSYTARDKMHTILAGATPVTARVLSRTAASWHAHGAHSQSLPGLCTSARCTPAGDAGTQTEMMLPPARCTLMQALTTLLAMQTLATSLPVQALTRKWCRGQQDAPQCTHSHENGVAGLCVVDAGQALAGPHVSPHHAGIARAILHAGMRLWNWLGGPRCCLRAITSTSIRCCSSSGRSLPRRMQVCCSGMVMGGPQSFKELSWASVSSSRYSPQL